MGSFVQARYVHWRTVGKCSIERERERAFEKESKRHVNSS